MKKLILAGLLLVAFGVQADCESGHWIDSVLDNGNIIKTEDGLLWRVNSAYTYNSDIWLTADNVLICSNGKMINTDEPGADTVFVTLIGR